jgi:hypothetical protein
MSSHRRKPSCGRLLPLVVLAALLLCAVGAAPGAAAPKTLHGSAYELMKGFMGHWDKDGFAKVTDLGAAKKYQVRLAQCKIVVNPRLRDANGGTPNAQYGPEPNVITFSKDPRKLTAGQRYAWGETVWHEVTHALEESNGDDQTNSDKLFQERNVEYMACVAKEALPWLDQLEKKAKAGASVADLRAIWQKYLDKMDYAATKLDETEKYPPDVALMKKWFGFSVDAAAIQKMYLTDKAFAGDQWENLREALSAADWSGTWQSYTFSEIRFTQSGVKVTGDSTQWDVSFTATAAGNVLKGRAVYDAGEEYVYDFELTMSADGNSFRGWRQLISMGGVPQQTAHDPWIGWRAGTPPIDYRPAGL